MEAQQAWQAAQLAELDSRESLALLTVEQPVEGVIEAEARVVLMKHRLALANATAESDSPLPEEKRRGIQVQAEEKSLEVAKSRLRQNLVRVMIHGVKEDSLEKRLDSLKVHANLTESFYNLLSQALQAGSRDVLNTQVDLARDNMVFVQGLRRGAKEQLILLRKQGAPWDGVRAALTEIADAEVRLSQVRSLLAATSSKPGDRPAANRERDKPPPRMEVAPDSAAGDRSFSGDR